MFKKILIANRGEIACRIIKSAKKMGIQTVAVYSDADAKALHVEMADEAVHIGNSPASESYLLSEKIIAACKQTGAQGVHPGYGFLSENAAFCQELKKNNIIFIGPNPKAISSMGDKIVSKEIAQKAGVSIVPGFMGLVDDAKHAVQISNEIGYPVMIKASAGGGGKGMRVANNDEEAKEGFERSKSEAKSSFGDDRIFIEKFITKPRHIEIQVLGDKHGNVIYLNERECSIQRRNQKIIEEAPSPFLDEATRKAMGEQAVMLAKSVDYDSAGTVEFIVDQERNFYFLEMNTRLQVEHPITEMITGIDLVEQMLLVGFGEKLAISQDDVKLDGWAIESRIYAEDPTRNFLPSIGRLRRYNPPEEFNSKDLIVRNDTGVFEGSEISTFYDPMIAKLCTWASNRADAIEAMSGALSEFEIEGVKHNISFLQTIMGHSRFMSGDISTAFIEEEFPDGFKGANLNEKQEIDVIACAAMMQFLLENRNKEIYGQQGEWIAFIDDKEILTKVEFDENGWSLNIGGQQYHALGFVWHFGASLAQIIWSENDRIVLKVAQNSADFIIDYCGATSKVKLLLPHIAKLMHIMPEKIAPDMSKYLLCPMPGQIVRIDVKIGDIVEDGQALAIVEAMKMENVLYASKGSRVKGINVGVGSVLGVDEVIMEFEEL
ncbi:MAG: acetyl/propionyl/methylcrotonyl-CoA carboxylase subunit alpha [Devosiaceae bacterium]|nr:acetyl/propionyl/methylcrotonyl-CoA carboxylase subunit alpha [Devosiaceae bacterium]